MKSGKIAPIVAILIAFTLYSKISIAQDNITTTRPSSSIGAWTLPSNSFQFEQGFTYVNDTLVLDGFFRLAVSKIGEIRMLTLYGSDNIVFEGKVMLLNPAEHKTGLAMKISVDQGFRVLDFRMIATQQLNDRFTLVSNVGVNPGGRWYGIVLLSIGLGDKFGTYIEGVYRDGFQQYNTGLTYLINSETQLDISTGWINNNNAFFGFDNSAYIGIGFARRLKFDNLIH